MKVPLEWLKEYVAIRLSPKALAERLTMAGLEVVEVLEIDRQPVFDIEVTPNRPDCLSVIGVAREVAAMTGQRLTLPSGRGKGQGTRDKGRSPQAAAHLSVRIEDKEGCLRYIGRLIEGVRIGSSPEWMQRRLIACGARPINNVVDITNYVLFEYGQPLHAFDFSRLANGTLFVRRANANEPITTLDGVGRKLSSDMLVIADAGRTLALAGIMGGTGSEVTPQTREVLLESALFDPVAVRRTARKLGFASESSYRFERGVDPAGVEAASARAASLICELAGGRETAVCDVGAKPLKRVGIILDSARLGRWLGIPMSPTAIRTTLARLSCHAASSGTERTLHVGVPSFRRDLAQDVDLFEELARLTGYDRVPSRLPTITIASRGAEDPAQHERAQSLKCLCASLGLNEAVTWSLISDADLSLCGSPATQAVRLANPLSQEHAYLRPSLLSGLLHTVRRNLTRGVSGVRVFEVGSVVRPSDGPGIGERLHVGLILAGVWTRDWHHEEPCSFFTLKGIVEALTARLCEGEREWVAANPPWAEPGQGAEIKLNGRSVGAAGQLSRATVEALDIEQDVWFAELSIADLLAFKRATRSVSPPSELPPVKRDLSVLVSEETSFESVRRTVHEVGGALAGRVELIDRYTGKPIPPGKAGLTFSIEYRDPSRTLAAAEVDVVHVRIGQALVSRCGATLR